MHNGTCIYCGQMFMLEQDEILHADGRSDLAATRKCKCEGAMLHKKKEDIKSKAIDNIDIAFFEEYPKVAELLKPIVDYMVDDHIDAITVKKGKLTAKLSATAAGAIKVTRKVTESKEFAE